MALLCHQLWWLWESCNKHCLICTYLLSILCFLKEEKLPLKLTHALLFSVSTFNGKHCHFSKGNYGLMTRKDRGYEWTFTHHGSQIIFLFRADPWLSRRIAESHFDNSLSWKCPKRVRNRPLASMFLEVGETDRPRFSLVYSAILGAVSILVLPLCSRHLLPLNKASLLCFCFISPYCSLTSTQKSASKRQRHIWTAAETPHAA